MKVPILLILSGGIIMGLIEERNAPADDSVSLGRQIYIAEGCIHCHSQYSRPATIDQATSGPTTNPMFKPNAPVLVGNRRQGPDLSNIGVRRSREWNRAHLIEPASISKGSRMPSFSHLFTSNDGEKGEALLDYLESCVSSDWDNWWATVYNWTPKIREPGDPLNGQALFGNHCAQCHGNNARGSGPASNHFKNKPLDLVSGTYRFAPPAMKKEQRDLRMAQIIKFGQAGTSMPGHEFLTDQNIIDLVAFLGSLYD